MLSVVIATAGESDGVIFAYNSSFIMIHCICTNNSADFDSFMGVDNSLFTITNSTFTNNSGIVMDILFSSFNIINSFFIDNIGTGFGGIMLVFHSSFNFTNSTITNSRAVGAGQAGQAIA